MRATYAYIQDWYAIKYSLGALNANEWVRQRRYEADAAPVRVADESDNAMQDSHVVESLRQDAESLRQDAFDHSTELAIACALTLKDLSAWPWRHPATVWRRYPAASARRRKALRQYLEDAMQPAALVLLAGVTRNGEPIHFDDGDGMLDVIRRRAADPRQLVEYVEALQRRAPRVDYNLACLYAEWRQPDAALRALRLSLSTTPINQRAGLAERAAHDPTLEPVMSKIPGVRTKEGILNWLEQQTQPSPERPN